MAKKTYVPALISLLRKVTLYILLHREKIIANLEINGVANVETRIDLIFDNAKLIIGEYQQPIDP